MAIILNIETSTKVCSVSVGENGKCIAVKESFDDNYSHAENLNTFIKTVLKEANLSFANLDAVAVSKGPGSYTGLRIGVSTAKGISFAIDKPIIAINSLRIMAENASKKTNALLCPMIDARRMEVFCAIYSNTGETKKETYAQILDDESYLDFLKDEKVAFFGNGMEKCKLTLQQHTNAEFIDGVYCSSKDMVSLSENLYAKKQFEDIAYFEPFYLKNFVAGKPKNLLA